jgi:hypothetical protein
MSSSSNPVNLESLKRLAGDGFNTGVLALLEHQALSQAIALRSLKGYDAHPREEVMALAEQVLPTGDSLFQLYTETMAGMSKHQVDDLEQVSSNLAVCAAALETAAVRTLAKLSGAPTRDKAQGEQVIGERYAQLLEAAQLIENTGVISVRQAGALANLTSRPTGPLSAFYDKACAIVADRQQNSALYRPRMAA